MSDIISRALQKGSYLVISAEHLVELVDDADGSREFADARILCLRRYSERRGVRHECIVLEVETLRGENQFLLLERASRTRWKQLASFICRYPVEDTAKLAMHRTHLKVAEHSVESAHIVFEQHSCPSMRHVSKLLSVISEHSTYYGPATENCWFFAAVIQDVLSHSFNGRLESGVPGQDYASRETRNAIKDSFQRWLAVPAIVELEATTPTPSSL